MKVEHLKSIINLLEITYEKDRKINDSIRDFIDCVAPWNYAPIVDWELTSMLSILKILYPEITELLEYHFFESMNMKWWWIVESDWKQYNYSDIDDIIQSMIDFWYITK